MTMKAYIAHKSDDGLREQSVLAHLQKTAHLAENFATVFGAGAYGSVCGWYHDIGKYAPLFQRRINGDKSVHFEHSSAGAYELWLRGESALVPAALCVAGHHGGLPDFGTKADGTEGSLASTFYAKMNRQSKRTDPEENYDAWHADVPYDILPVKLPTFLTTASATPFSNAFFTRMLYSCLVDADYLNTEEFMSGSGLRDEGESLTVLEEKLNYYLCTLDEKGIIATGHRAAINRKRREIRADCVQAAGRPQGLFRLTVPTGGGKTLSSMAFALSHAITHGMRRVIYVIPYVSIIRQTTELFSGIFGKENVLAHYHSSDALCRESESADEDTRFTQRAAENWDKPIVVTTNVQFFESLYASRSSRCRKLHNIAGSVLIFDEAQMLPPKFLKPCIRAVCELTDNYDCTAVLCTATQPALQNLLDDRVTEEIYPDVKGLYEFFRRIHIRKGGDKSVEEVAVELSEQEQVLCIVNTKKTAREIASHMRGEGCYQLTTWLTPADIGHILQEIRDRLSVGERCRVVATSLVEAGVDLDFPAVYREQAGLDNIIQAAGRCNREGRHPAEQSAVTVFSLTPARKVPDEISRARAACCQTMEEQSDVTAPEAIEEYFTLLYRQGLPDGLAAPDYWRRLPFATAADEFRMIQTETQAILIPSEESKAICDAFRRGGMSRVLLRQAGQYSVMLHTWEMEKLQACGVVEVIDDRIAILCDHPAGCGEMTYYSSETGISIPEKNEAIIY